MTDRPAGACLTHRPPKPGRPWCRADDGFTTCGQCYSRLHTWLSPISVDEDGVPMSIPGLYATLDAAPGSAGTGRRAPGFGSRSPANDRVVAMRDPRTVAIADGDPCSAASVLRAWVTYVWDERYDHAALDLPDYRKRRRELPTSVDAAAVWLDNNLDWLTRQTTVTDLHDELRELIRQLRSARPGGVADQDRPVGHCIEMLESGECKTPIYMPRGEKPRAPDEPIITLPELICPVCDSSYTGTRLIRLRLAEEKAKAQSAGAPAA